jgi:hypothetical protein
LRFWGWWLAENMLNFPERRRVPRYKGELLVEMERGTGITRDFSAVGVFFVTEQSPSVGEPIEIFIVIEHSDLGYPFRLRCQGSVLRVEPTRGKTGVAVAIHSYSFVGLQEPKDI